MNKFIKKIVFSNFYIWACVSLIVIMFLYIEQTAETIWHGMKYTLGTLKYRYKFIKEGYAENWRDKYKKAKEDRK